MMKKQINFIPADLRPRIEIPNELAPIVTASFLVTFVLFNVVKIQVQTRFANDDLASAQARNTELISQIQVLTEAKKKVEQKNDALTTLQQVLSRKNYWSEIFKELSMLIPKGIWLTSFTNSDQNQLVLKGESTSQAVVAEFLKLLETSQHFSGARIHSTERESGVQPPRHKFEFTIPVSAATAGGT